MIFQDKTLLCRDCRQAFTWSAGEQEFYANKDLTNEPKRCPNCRISVRLLREGKDTDYGAQVACHECGRETRLPFKPTGVRPVYCQKCFHEKKMEAQENA